MTSQKTIVVSGCTRGIGRAICDLFISKGYAVAGYARNEADLESMRASYRKSYPGQAFLLMQADATVKQDIIRFAGEVKKTFPQTDILVNNTGTYQPGQIMAEPDGMLESMMQTNLYSAYYLTRALNGCIRKHIVNIASIASLQAYEGGASYTISKFAMLGFSRQLRHELRESGIKVTTLLPGAVRTDSWNGTNLPEERFLQPGDIAETIYTVCCSLTAGADVEEIILRPQKGDI